MLTTRFTSMALLSSVLVSSVFVIGCGASQTPPVEPAAEPQPTKSEPVEEAKGPSAEELEKEAAQERLANDRAKMQGAAQVELRRWTPELRKNSQALADKKYASLKEGVTAALAGAHRVPGNADRDAARKPLETLSFFGMTPKMTVLEYGPGGGWYTEILAPVLAAQGKLWVTSADPQGPQEDRNTYYAEQFDLFLKKSPEVYGKVAKAIFTPAQPKLELHDQIDLVLVIRGMHGMVQQGLLGTWLDDFHDALKADGVLGVVQHRAQADADPMVSAKTGYLPEPWLIEQIQSHGFVLAEKSEINANPRDTKNYPDGVWTLPPSLRLGEQDREKYIAIGESDRMTLKFKKAKAAE